MSHAQEANVLTAVALELAARVQAAGERASGQAASGSAAIAALHGLTGGSSIDELRGVVALTHSGAVRLVDRLAGAGLVERRGGVDGRAVSVVLTVEGRRVARRVLAAREAAIESALAGLSSGERATLSRLHERVLMGVVEGAGGRRRVCRMCDVEACGRACPAARAEQQV